RCGSRRRRPRGPRRHGDALRPQPNRGVTRPYGARVRRRLCQRRHGPRHPTGAAMSLTSLRPTAPHVTPQRPTAPLVIAQRATAHSHAFHRALRGRTHGAGGSFWTWRTVMYEVAAALDPDSYFELARTVYLEMALAGITCVGEFHYLHHAPGGTPYADPNAMG